MRRWANQALRWSNKARAGVNPLSAMMMPRGVDWKAPSDALLIRLMASWYSSSTPFFPFQVSSEA